MRYLRQVSRLSSGSPALGAMSDRSAYVYPRPTCHDLPEVAVVCPEFTGQIARRGTGGGVAGSDLDYLGFGQATPNFEVPESHTPIKGVIFLGSQPQMGRVTADRVVAGMEHFETLGNVLASAQIEGDPSRIFVSWGCRPAAHIESASALSSSSNGPTGPRPAGVRTARLIDPSPESLIEGPCPRSHAFEFTPCQQESL